jgi:hypothetical protein
LPKFNLGLWEFRRTLRSGRDATPQVATTRKCTDPGADMREKMEALKQKGCRFAPLQHHDNRYISSWLCPVSGSAVQFRDVLLVKDANSYEIFSEARAPQRATEERIESTRIGECPGVGPGAQLTPQRQSPLPPPASKASPSH